MKNRGFEIVRNDKRQHKYPTPTIQADHKIDINGLKWYVPEIILPKRSDQRSAGYDFHTPNGVTLFPQQKTIIWTDVKAYMHQDEVLEIYIRSSLAIKNGIMLSNNVGIIDSSYYSNEGNDGNIGIAVVNTTGITVTLEAGDRIAQGVFKKYLITDDDATILTERKGGFGSSGK